VLTAKSIAMSVPVNMELLLDERDEVEGVDDVEHPTSNIVFSQECLRGIFCIAFRITYIQSSCLDQDHDSTVSAYDDVHTILVAASSQIPRLIPGAVKVQNLKHWPFSQSLQMLLRTILALINTFLAV
jgi:hypothetical protein